MVQAEGNRKVSRAIDHDNLDAIPAVGYRVRPDPVTSGASGVNWLPVFA